MLRKLEFHEVRDVLVELTEEPSVSWRRRDRLAVEILISNIDDVDLVFVDDCKTANELWTKLQKKYSDNCGVDRVKRFRKMFELKFESRSLVEDLMAYNEELTMWEGMSGITIQERVKCDWLLAKLPMVGFEVLISNSANVPRGEESYNRLFTEAMSKAEGFKIEDPIGMMARGGRQWRNPIKCFNCGGFGHIQRFCKVPRKNFVNVMTSDVVNKNNSEIYVGGIFTNSTRSNIWILDSGANAHVTNDRCFFARMNNHSSRILCASDHSCEVTGIGDVSLKCPVANRVVEVALHDVLYAPKLAFNIVSVVELTRCGLTVFFSTNRAIVRRGEEAVFVAKKNPSNLFEVVMCKSVMGIWHDRLGHPGQEISRLMKNSHPEVQCLDGNCEVCVKAKMKQLPYTESKNRASYPLELIHSDVCGPIEPVSFDGQKYFVIFEDDYSKYVSVFTIKDRSSVLECFRTFRQMLEARCTPYKIRALRTDQGREYLSGAFEEYLKDEGIEHQLSVAYCHQQNGRAERCLQKLQQSARSLLIGGNVPSKYWSVAVLAAAYLNNRLPSTVTSTIPYELLFRRRSLINHLKVFGSSAYRWIPNNNRKFDARCEKLMFAGYCQTMKAYRLIDVSTGKQIFDRNVKVIENKPYFEQVVDNTGMFETEEIRERRLNAGCPPKKLTLNVTVDDEPKTYKEALKSKFKDEWIRAMCEEMEAMRVNDVYEEVDESEINKSVVGSKWVYSTKRDENKKIERFKARLVAKGFTQEQGIDFNETFSPVVNFSTVRTALTLAAWKGYNVVHLDVKSAFLNSGLQEEIYMEPPEGFDSTGKVWKLKKCIYGLKQSPRCWSSLLNKMFVGNGFVRSTNDRCLFVDKKNELWLLVYVDDILVISGTVDGVERVKKVLQDTVEFRNLGEVKKFCGIQVDRSGDRLQISQEQFIDQILEKFRCESCKELTVPLQSFDFGPSEAMEPRIVRELIGSLQYLASRSRPDIAASVNAISAFMHSPTTEVWKAAKQILAYVKGTKSWKLVLSKFNEDVLVVYTDASHGSGPGRRSISGNLVQIYGSTVHWSSKRQHCVAISTAESEYYAMSNGLADGLWLQRIMEDFDIYPGAVDLRSDSQSAIRISEDGTQTRSKHIDIRKHFILENELFGKVKVSHVAARDQLADMLTKPLKPLTKQVAYRRVLRSGGVW